VFALVADVSGVRLPLLLLPHTNVLQAKLLVNAIAYTNSDGIATFTGLGFQVGECDDGVCYLLLVRATGLRARRLQVQGTAEPISVLFSADGVFSAMTDPIVVNTSVANVTVMKSPVSIPFVTGGLCVCVLHVFVEAVWVTVATATPVSTLGSDFPAAVVRVTDASGLGITGER
jgi:hypothetical protein